MEYHRESFSGTYFDSVLMGVQFHIIGNILMVFVTIHLLGEFNGIYHRKHFSGTNFYSILMGANGKPLDKFKWYLIPFMNNESPVVNKWET